MAGFSFDRSKLKTTTAEVIEEQKQVFTQGDRKYLSIEKGKDNKFRIFPFHPDGGGNSFAVPLCVTYLEIKRPKYDKVAKKVVEGQFEYKSFPIFNSIVHGGWPFDLVEVYMEIAKKTAIPAFLEDVEDQAEKEQLFNTIWTLIRGNAQAKINGIAPQRSWVAYAAKAIGKEADGSDKWSDVGLWNDIKPSVKDKMNERASELEIPDPFSHWDEGIPVIVTKAEKAEKSTDWYKVKLDQKKDLVTGKVLGTYNEVPLTDAQLEAWSKLKPLHELYVDSFKHSDLQKQVEGLQRFDQQLAKKGYPINVFGLDEFLDYVEKAYEMCPEEVAEDHSELPFAEEEEQREILPPPTAKTDVKKVVKPTAPVTKKNDPELAALDKTFSKPPGKVTAAAQAAAKLKATPTVTEEEQVGGQQPPVASGDRMASLKARFGKK